MKKVKPKADYLIEVSWEVCNKVGGINTVIKTKLLSIQKNYENYLLIGPYFPEKVAGIFKEETPPSKLKEIFNSLASEGIHCHYGRWMIEGQPLVILVDAQGYRYNTNNIKKEFWDEFKVDSLNAPWDYDEPVAWGYAVGKLLEAWKHIHAQENVVAQFHEWLTGPAILYLKKNQVNIATVFTTHATALGRAMVGNNIDLFCAEEGKQCTLETENLDKKAYELSVPAKHQLEKASAQQADIFTTVSKITAFESKYVLGREPDVILPNGIDMEGFPSVDDRAIKHKLYKNRIKEFILYYFFPYYRFNLDNTLFFFTASRYEFRSKGLDVLIQALAKLNQRLKQEKNDITIVTFFWIPAENRGVNQELMENKTLFKNIKDELDDSMEDVKHNLIYDLISRTKITAQRIFSKDFIEQAKIGVLKLSRKGTPPLSTHLLVHADDAMVQECIAHNLTNKKTDKVKVVIYPTYLTGADGLLDLDYYQSIMGSNLGIFPSFYEPWGYTPMEAGALGVSAITTDLAGFGRHIDSRVNSKQPGIYVLKRLNRQDEDVVRNLADYMYKFVHLPQQQRIADKMEARRLASMSSWGNIIHNYLLAHNKAIEKRR